MNTTDHICWVDQCGVPLTWKAKGGNGQKSWQCSHLRSRFGSIEQASTCQHMPVHACLDCRIPSTWMEKGRRPFVKTQYLHQLTSAQNQDAKH